MHQKFELDLTEAQNIVNAVLAKAQEAPEKPIAVAVADRDGNLVAFARMDNCSPLPRNIAVAKAYTAGVMGNDTGQIAERMRKNNIKGSDLGDPRLVFVQGGVVIKSDDGIILGGIGVSGLAAQEDEELAIIGLATFS
jgi:uncharacterized protein GlcG (DUF336 family)